jgi:hypothetical protein
MNRTLNPAVKQCRIKFEYASIVAAKRREISGDISDETTQQFAFLADSLLDVGSSAEIAAKRYTIILRSGIKILCTMERR